MNCTVCGISFNDVPLYRNNPKGEAAIWRCDFHLDKPPSDDVAGLAQIISDADNKRKPV